MNLKDITDYLEIAYPLSLQEDWDNSGLLLGNKEEINTVLVCLDVTPDIVRYAKDNKVDLIISHHPLIFGAYYKNYEYIRHLYLDLLESNISLYAMHTNFDNALLGMNTTYIKELGYAFSPSPSMIQYFDNSKDIYRILSNLRYPVRIYNKKDKIDKVAVLLGAGGSMIEEVASNKVDMYLSSEFKHHEIMYAKEHGITLVDVSHQAEIIFVEIIKDYLNQTNFDINLLTYEDDYDIINL